MGIPCRGTQIQHYENVKILKINKQVTTARCPTIYLNLSQSISSHYRFCGVENHQGNVLGHCFHLKMNLNYGVSKQPLSTVNKPFMFPRICS